MNKFTSVSCTLRRTCKLQSLAILLVNLWGQQPYCRFIIRDKVMSLTLNGQHQQQKRSAVLHFLYVATFLVVRGSLLHDILQGSQDQGIYFSLLHPRIVLYSMQQWQVGRMLVDKFCVEQLSGSYCTVLEVKTTSSTDMCFYTFVTTHSNFGLSLDLLALFHQICRYYS